MMCYHLIKDAGDMNSFFIHIHTKYFDKRAVFLYLIYLGVRHQWNDLIA